MRNFVAISAFLTLAACGSQNGAEAHTKEAEAVHQAGCSTINNDSAPNVLGVHLNTSVETAKREMKCAYPKGNLHSFGVDDSNIAYYFNLFPFRFPPSQSIGLDLNGSVIGENFDTMTPSFFGFPGKEQLIQIRRTVNYPDGKKPPMTDAESSLIAKYGKFTRQKDYDGNMIDIVWAYDPAGKLITEGDPRYNTCGAFSGGPLYADWSDCGVVIFARLHAADLNKTALDTLEFQMIDSAKTRAFVKNVADISNKINNSGGTTSKF